VGNFGEVYLIHDPELKRELAVKVLKHRWSKNEGVRNPFLAEAELTAQLQHPNIPPVHLRGELPDGRLYFTMKLVRGTTLTHLLNGRADLNEDRQRFLLIFERLCEAIAYAHDRRVIHRDIKPANVMVGAFGEVLVMDWGLGKVLASEERSKPAEASEEASVHTALSDSPDGMSGVGTVKGTPEYMSPEQAGGLVDQVDERCDVFLLGGVLCYILTGKPTYPGDGALGRAMRGDLDDTFARLETSGQPAELIRLAHECLNRERDCRPRNGEAVYDRIKTFREEEAERTRRAEIEEARARTSEQATKELMAEQARALNALQKQQEAERAKRRHQLSLAAALLVLLGLVGGGVWWWLRVRDDALTHQLQTDQEARSVLKRATELLDQGWEAQDVEKLNEAKAEGDRAADMARTGGASAEVQQEIGAFLTKTEERSRRWRANDDLRNALLDIAFPPEDPKMGELMRLVSQGGPSVDEQYDAAFRRWGLEINRAAEGEVMDKLRAEPEVLVQTVVAGLDHWMLRA
jgi:hypothetical protein